MLKVAHYFSNTQGLNLTDSPFFVKDGQATGGFNYDYVRTGGIQKIRGLHKINSSANAQLKTLGVGVHETTSGTKTIIRSAGTKIQTFNTDTGAFTNQAADTAAAGTDFLTSGSNQPVVNSFFSTASASVLWLAGGGMTYPVGYTGSNITTNGVAVPSGTFTAANQGAGTGGAWGAGTGVYYYALVLRKLSTQALSNATLDQTVTIANATDSVLLTFPTGVDATLYDKWYIYRSSVGGVSGFTAGSLVAQVTVGTASYTDTNVTLASSQTVPRAGSTSLDNAVLPSGTYKSLALFKRRLATAYNSTVCISDLNKPESWPTGLQINIPSAGPITGLAVVGYNSPQTFPDELLVVFKERETWVITGSGVYDSDTGLYDIALKFVDGVGCVNQALAAIANGFLCWIDYRGAYMWNGLGKPIYCSRLVEGAFLYDGDLDKTNFSKGWGVYCRKKNQVIWTLSHRTKGTNKVQLKLDLRLAAPLISDNPVLGNNVIEAAFAMDAPAEALYGGVTYIPTDGEEIFLVGDDAGFMYKQYFSASDNGEGIDFSYQTKALDQESPSIAKQYAKVVVYIDQSVDKNLTLDYWAGYRMLDSERSQIAQSMDTGAGISGSLWDLATYDISLWDEYSNKPVPLVFNLHSEQNNNQGDSIMLKFSQSEATTPVTIHGFSIFYNEIGPRK